MSEVLTIAEIHAKFPDQWVLLDDIQTDETLAVRAGRVLAWGKDRDEVYRQAAAFRPRYFTVVYTGETPKDVIYVL